VLFISLRLNAGQLRQRLPMPLMRDTLACPDI
jgi:hypothetical protein